MKVNGISTARVRIEGVAPLLMHNARLVDDADSVVQKMAAITAKKKNKTSTDEKQLVKLAFLGGLYENDSAGIHMPAANIEACLRDGARTTSKGKDIESGAQVDPEFIPLIYDGPKKGAGLFKDKNFIDRRPVWLKGNTAIMRTRPRFNQWALEFELSIVEEIVNKDDVAKYLIKAGLRKGLGDYRPKFGRFEVARFEWL
jgi:hypothetical protein